MGRSARRPAVVCATVLLGTCALVASCVDGTTPDCSDAATQCGPNLDGSFDGQGDVSVTIPEAAPDNSTPDAADEPDADAGDEI